MFCIEIAFGHCSSDGNLMSKNQIAIAEERCLLVFSNCFRGSQVHHPLGAYLTTENCVVIEPSTVIRGYTQEVDSYLNELVALAREIATILGQESVLLVNFRLQGSMQWIEPEAPVPVAKQPVLATSLPSYSETL